MAKKGFHVRVEGLSDTLDALEELPKATATNVQKRALNEAADPFQQEAEALAPEATGRLRRSVVVSSRLARRARKKSKVEVYIGAGPLRQAIPQEFGTAQHPPHPFMRPSWDHNKMSAIAKIRDILKEQIEKARARAARKAARLLQATKLKS